MACPSYYIGVIQVDYATICREILQLTVKHIFKPFRRPRQGGVSPKQDTFEIQDSIRCTARPKAVFSFP